MGVSGFLKTTGPSESHIGQTGGTIKRVYGSIIRPNDTNAYSALDCINDSAGTPTLPSIAGCARVSAGAGYIVFASLKTNNRNNTARHKIHLYAQQVTAVADNAGFPILFANKTKKIGEITFSAMTTENVSSSDSSGAQNTDLLMPFECDTGSTSLYWLLETLDARTPAAQEEFHLTLGVDQS